MAAAPILILSNPRTGSTLLRLLLDTHPAICSPGELSLGKLCRDLYGAIESTVGGTDTAAAARRDRCLAETRRIVEELLGKYCEARGKERWCEKSPCNVEFLGILRSVFPDAACLCLHRHCLDTACSMIEFYGPSPEGMKEYLDRNGGHAAAAFVERWCDHTERLLAFEAENPRRSLRLTYEHLVGDPDAALRPILSFIGVSWVPGLAQRVFESPHDLGRGDPKVVTSAAVENDRVGRGRRLDVHGVPERLRSRMRRLHDVLGYADEPQASADSRDETFRAELTSIAELFASSFPRQLARYGERLASATSALGIVVNGAGGGSWTIGVDASGARILTEAAAAPVTMVMDAADLLAVVNRRLTLADFRERVRVQGDLGLFDAPLGERLMWVLFGDEIRRTREGALQDCGHDVRSAV